MAKTIQGVIGLVGESTSNYIKQINDGTTAHDLALTKTITFFNGNAGEGIEWDGTQAIEVVIPTVADIISDPVRLVGVISSENQTAANNPANGNLVYIEENCTFAGQVCEAGDMAVYSTSDSSWHVISGENQVSIIGTEQSGVINHNLTGTATSVLRVEGKDLSLAIDYADVAAKVKVDKNEANDLNLNNAQLTITEKYLTLTQEQATTSNIADPVSISLPYALSNGAVTISQSVLVSSNFSFDGGAFPEVVLNSAAISLSVSHNMSIGKQNETDGTSGDYLTSVDAIKAVSLVEGGNSDFPYVSGISSAEGSTFVTGIHAYTEADAEKTPVFTLYGAVTAASVNNTFVTGISSAEDSTGDVVSSITIGEVTIGEGTDVLTGLSGGLTSVLTSVSFGSVVQDTTAQWFYSGLGTEGSTGDVVTNVTTGAVTLVSGADANLNATAMTSASVSNHVLSFNTGTFMVPVTVSQATTTVSKRAFTLSGVALSDTGFTLTPFTKGGISQAATTVSYKNFTNASVSLEQGSTAYFLDTSTEHTYQALFGHLSVSTTEATVTKNTPVLSNPTVSANIPVNSVAVSVTDGTLPSLTISEPTGTLTGSVGTDLSLSTVSWLGVATEASILTVPGAYSIISTDSSANAVSVGKAGKYDVENAYVTVPSNYYVTDVYVDGTAAGDYVAPQNNG